MRICGCNKKRFAVYLTANLFYMNSFAKQLNVKQKIIPIIVGNAAAINVHFMLPVSFFIVSNVVEQGQ